MQKKYSILIIIIGIIGIIWYFTNSQEEINKYNTTEVVENNTSQSEKTNNNNTNIEPNSAIKKTSNKYIANKHYIVIENPVETENINKVELRELFWYECPHCYKLLPYLEYMKKGLEEGVNFIMQPAIFSDRWQHGAWLFYVLEFLNETERLHEKLFHAIHKDQIDVSSKEKFIKWLELNGVNKEKAEKASKEYSVATNINKAKNKSREYKVKSVPVFIVNGKYWVDVSTAGGVEEMHEIIEYLIAKELNK